MNSVLLIFTILFAFLVQCISPSSAGGTADTGNARVAAVILTPDGTPAAGVPVILTKKDYLAEITSDSLLKAGNITFLSTDDSGAFNIDSLDSGEYVIEVNDNDSSAVCFLVSIARHADSTTHLHGIMKTYGSIEGNAGVLEDTTENRYLQIYGLNRCVPIGADGTFAVRDLPEGTFDLKIISDVQDWDTVNIPNISVTSNQTVELPAAGWLYREIIIVNTTSTGADIDSSLAQVPLLVRLSAGNFNFSSAGHNGNDLRFVSMDSSTVLPHVIESWDSSKQLASIWVLLDTVYGNRNGPGLFMQWGNRNAALFTDSANVFGDDYLTCFHFNGSVKNSLKNGLNAIDSGSINDSDGIIAGARKFDGTKSFIYIKGVPERKSGSISFWFRPAKTFNTQSDKSQGIWGKKIGDSLNYTITLQGKDFYPGDGNVGKLITKMEDPDTGCYQAGTTTTFAANTWYHVLWAWGGSSEELYVNGILENQISNVQGMLGITNDDIGRVWYDASNISNGDCRYFNGTIDEFRMDSTHRSSAWAKFNYMNQGIDQKVVSFSKK